jgi:hypothetical protein
MTRLFWDETSPLHDTVPLERFIDRDRTEWKQSQFDGRGEWSLLGLELLALSAVIVISIVAWLV